MKHQRNRDGIQLAALRKNFDERFEAVHDLLENAYYKYWRHGVAHEIKIGNQRYDVNPKPTIWNEKGKKVFDLTAKEFFDKLHGLIWQHYNVMFNEHNNAQPAKLQADPTKHELVEKSNESVRQIAALQQEGIEIEIL